MPERRFRKLSSTAVYETPIGEYMPTPVMTTLFIVSFYPEFLCRGDSVDRPSLCCAASVPLASRRDGGDTKKSRRG
jgi:hypothetical protein